MGEHQRSWKLELPVNEDLSMGTRGKTYLDPREAQKLVSGKGVSVGPVTTIELYDPRKKYPVADAWKPGGFARLAASDRSALIRLASSLEKGSEERKAILAGLKNSAHNDWGRDFWKLPPKSQAFIQDLGLRVHVTIDKARKLHGFEKLLPSNHVGDMVGSMVTEIIGALTQMAERTNTPLP